jgi:hypothetical protein
VRRGKGTRNRAWLLDIRGDLDGGSISRYPKVEELWENVVRGGIPSSQEVAFAATLEREDDIVDAKFGRAGDLRKMVRSQVVSVRSSGLVSYLSSFL